MLKVWIFFAGLFLMASMAPLGASVEELNMAGISIVIAPFLVRALLSREG